jgi:FtsZ-binding cell division protein ZapB
VTTIVRPENHRDDLEGLHARATELTASVEARMAELEQVKSDLEQFRIAYRQRVGSLHDQLDALDVAIAEAELGELAKRLEGADADPGASAANVSPAPPQYTSDAVRKLFRDVAKVIHPDLADDDHARDRRHALMVEANRAYASGDEAQLRWILEAWERSPEAVQGSGPEAMRLRLERRIAQAEETLETLADELDELKASSLWQLKAMVDDAAAKGKDLVRDMVVRLKRDIMVATNRLDAMRPPS